MSDKGRPQDSPDGDPQVSSDEPLVLGEGEASYLKVNCPSCSSAAATLRALRLDVPYFGEIIESIFLCADCGFRHTDTLIPRVGQAVEYSLRVDTEQDLFVRAVKSSSATVAVEEMGLLWEPGPASLAEVTNVEGLLRHFESAILSAKALFATDEVHRKGDELLEQLRAVIDGKRACLLSVKDPYGNSALIDPRGKVSRRELAPLEASELATGEYIIELGGEGDFRLRQVDR